MAVAANISNARRKAAVTLRYSVRVGELSSPDVMDDCQPSAPTVDAKRYYGDLAKAFRARRVISDDAGVSSFDPDA